MDGFNADYECGQASAIIGRLLLRFVPQDEYDAATAEYAREWKARFTKSMDDYFDNIKPQTKEADHAAL